jgi:hypothetical protein
MFLGNIVRFGFPQREDSKVISAKKEVFFQNITFNSKVKKVKAEILSQEKMRLHEHLRPIVFLRSSAKEVAKNAFQALHIALSF